MWFRLVDGELIELLKILSNGTFVIKMKKNFQNKLGSTYYDISILGKCCTYFETEVVYENKKHNNIKYCWIFFN